ncbi:hypothetical protein N0V93_009111 [Gnomoniopsis smithogilvyi]|uniref:HMG box domain-containing protein n=1 Tax=Gnomoniopsis smithogilvyi TaxID=1191159 RepID=A0A9W9CTB9_9PEZI|nr:hypothetical protein N0V93_009111 [Gnomoniopsis smithogilvyi]
MSAEASHSAAPKITIVRDTQDRQIAYVDTKIGYAAAVENVGPSYQRIVLGGGPVTVFADYSLDRFIFAPLILRDILPNPRRQHLFDLPKRALEADEEAFKFPDEIIDIRTAPGMQQNDNMSIELPISSDITDVGNFSNRMSTNMTPREPATPQTSTVKMRIKRPRNSWIIYRSEKSRQLHVDRPGMSAGAISTEVARLWKIEAPEVKAYYGQLAELESEEHKKLYPDYRYTPGR